MKNLLIVVDMQNDFVDGSLGSERGTQIVPAVCREIRSVSYDTIVATLDTHYENYLETLEGKNLPVVHCVKDSEGWQINKDVQQALDEVGCQKYFIKETFGSLQLADWVRENSEELESVTLIGLCTDICVMSNALLIRAALPNLPIYIVEDACWATSQQTQDASIAVLESNQIYRRD